MIYTSEASPPKFALIGSSSAGKTTLTYSLCGELKIKGIRVDGILQQDRRMPFPKEMLDTDIEAQHWFLFNMATQESYFALKRENDLVLSDRSVLDFYAYCETIHGRQAYLFDWVIEWCKTYKSLYYLEPLPFDNDGVRPPEAFRDKVDLVLQELLHHVPNVVRLPRERILADILHKIDRILGDKELNLIPSILKMDILLGGSYAFNRQTKKSDVDIYILGTETRKRWDLSAELKIVFGLAFDVNEVNAESWAYLKTQFKSMPYVAA